MFRITPCIINARYLLYRYHPAGIQLVAISHTPPNFKYKDPTERDTFKIPPPPPPPPPKDDSYFWGAMALLCLTGGFAVLAKSQPEVRDWLTIYAPWFDDLIAIAYQENMTYSEYVTQRIDHLKKKIAYYGRDDRPKECSLDGSPVSETWPSEEECSADDDEENEEATPCEKLPSPVITKDICEIEFCLRDLAETAFNNYMTARDACSYYNQLFKETMMNYTVAGGQQLFEARDERLGLVKKHICNAETAAADLDELTRYLDCGVKNATKVSIDNTKALLKENQTKIKTIKISYQWECDKALAMDDQLQQVNESVVKYVNENQTMFAGLKYDSKKPHISGDVDLHLYHTLRYIEKLKVQLSEAVSAMTDRVNRGVGTLPLGDSKATEYAIDCGYKAKKAELDNEYRKRYNDMRTKNDKVLADSLKTQLARSQDTLTIKLQEKEKEFTENLNRIVAEKVAAEKNLMKRQLNELTMKVKIVEDKLNARLRAERETRRSQELWTAGASLLAATKKGESFVNVEKELNAIEKATDKGDKLVLTVMKAIPESVRVQGLVPESVLREKYHSMEKTALKVALVEHDGAPLPIYFLSWLQSILLFMKISGIPKDEIDKPPQVPSKDLDTFDLLQRARFWIERGNIAYALRYVNALEGASRGAATTWREAARSYLETRQAAEAVLAHAAALGLQYI